MCKHDVLVVTERYTIHLNKTIEKKIVKNNKL